MKKLLLTITCSLILFLSHAQVRNYGKLIKEDLNFTEMNAKYGNDPRSENYIFYKIATTIPVTVKNEIDDKYKLTKESFEKMFPDRSEEAVKLSKVLFDTLTMRVPKSDEDQNFIYYEAQIDAKSIPALLCGTMSSDMKFLGGNNYRTMSYPNLLNMSILLTPTLLDANNIPVKLGEKCNVVTSYDEATDSYKIEIAVGLRDSFQKVVQSGNIIFSARMIEQVKEVKITKNDIGKKLSNMPYTVLEFENGVIHLLSDKRFKMPSQMKLIGSIDHDKFRINIKPIPIVLAVYGKYRGNPKLDFDKFVSQEGKKINNIDPKEFNYRVDVYNIGYDIDTLHFVDPNSPVISQFKYNAAVSKKENSDYSIRTIARTKIVEGYKELDEYTTMMRLHIQRNVKYPQEAQENKISGSVVFEFEFTPTGDIVNVKFIESPHESLNRATLAVIKTLPKFKRTDNEDHNIKSFMRIVFAL